MSHFTGPPAEFGSISTTMPSSDGGGARWERPVHLLRYDSVPEVRFSRDLTREKNEIFKDKGPLKQAAVSESKNFDASFFVRN